MRIGSVTHNFNMSQNYVPLTFQVVTGGMNVQAPANANLAPPGYYMLFIVTTDGVPSVAPIVNLPIGIVTAVIALRLLESDRGIGLGQGADVLGAIMVTSALMLGVYTIVQTSDYGLASPRTIALGGLRIRDEATDDIVGLVELRELRTGQLIRKIQAPQSIVRAVAVSPVASR